MNNLNKEELAKKAKQIIDKDMYVKRFMLLNCSIGGLILPIMLYIPEQFPEIKEMTSDLNEIDLNMFYQYLMTEYRNEKYGET